MADDVDAALSGAKKKCNYCGSKTAKKFVKCVNCRCVYHNSCAIKIKGCIQDPDRENSIICCSEKSAVKSNKQTSNINVERDPIQTEVILLRKLIKDAAQLHHQQLCITSKSNNIPINKQNVLLKPIEELKAKVNPAEVRAGINKISKLQNEVVLIDLNEKNAPERLKTLLSEKLSENYETNLTNLNKPKVMITGLPQKNDNKEELMKELIALNVSINEEDKIDIKYTRQASHSRKWILYLETSAKTYHKLVNKYINIGWGTHFVREGLNMRIGYSSMFNRIKVCSHCAGLHDVKQCKSEIMQCTNCKYLKEKFNTTFNANHTAFSAECQIHQKKIN